MDGLTEKFKTARAVEFRVFVEGHKKAYIVREKAPKGFFIDQELQLAAMGMVSAMDEKFPSKKFKAIRISFNRYNIVHDVGRA